MTLYVLFILFGYSFFNPVSSGVIQLKDDNINEILAKHELVFINFYVDWCHYSNLMQPIFTEAAELVEKEFGNSGRIAMGKVDCDVELAIAKRFQISKYPTLKVSLNGDVMKREYREKRSADAILNYIQEQLRDPIKEFTNLDEVKNLSTKKRVILAYFKDRSITSPEYTIFRRVAANLKEDCDFYAGFGDAVTDSHPGDQPTIVFRPDTDLSHENEDIYTGKIHADELKIWAQEKCIPLVREITFDNAEELTEEGMPFMILFYHPNNTAPIKDYKAKVEAELIHEKQSVNFLIADGKTFSHPLAHLEKTIEDLPVLAIDSFRHMYVFPDFQDIYKPGKLRKFVDDLHSGKLHREFHYGPEPTTEEKSESKPESKSVDHETEHPHDVKSDESQMDVEDETPPDSTFIKLAPSDKRYTLVRNEL